MANTFSQIYIQTVFAVAVRRSLIKPDFKEELQKYITGIGQPWSVQFTPKYLYSGDGTGKIYRLDHDGKLLGWAQTSLGQGQTGCLIHEIHCESENVIYKGDCSTWTVEKITIIGGARASAQK